MNSSWVPVGDDAAGMYYTQQTYDWQGRPLVTTNPDLHHQRLLLTQAVVVLVVKW